MENAVEWSEDDGTERMRGARFWRFDDARRGMRFDQPSQVH